MRFRVDIDGETREIDVERKDGAFVVRVDGLPYRTRVGGATDVVHIRVGAKTFRVRFQGEEAIVDGRAHRVRIVNASPEIAATVEGPRKSVPAVVEVRPPMPGRVVRIVATPGTLVRRGQTLMVLEAMKMQNEIPAPGAGVVRDVRVTEGETVTADRVVASVELSGSSGS